MYRGIAHSGLSRIPTSRHVQIHINADYRYSYSYRQLSSTAALWKLRTPIWAFRGNKASREKASRIEYENMVNEKIAASTRSSDSAWDTIPPPAAKRTGPVEFRAKPPTEGTALTGSETSFIWDKGKESESAKVDSMLPASAVLNRPKFDPRADKKARRAAERDSNSGVTKEGVGESGSADTNITPNINWTKTSSGEKPPWPAKPNEVTWSPPRIRTHPSNTTPTWEEPVESKRRAEREEKTYPLPKFRAYSGPQTEKDDYDTRAGKWPSQTYSPVDGELESWSVKQSELAESSTYNELAERRRFLSDYDGRPQFTTYGHSRLDGFYGGDREEMTVLKKPARVLPFSTGTSEFLYGYNICKLALKEKRRKIYKLYVYTGLMRQSGTLEKESVLRSLALESKITVESTMDVGLLDAMSKGRPHNGFALEAEPLEVPRVGHLVAPSDLGVFNAPIYQSSQYVQIRVKDKDRRPFVLVLDEVLDGGNFGAILRSAYFLGVDAVFIVSKNSTPATAVTSRSSAGALECIDYYDVGNLASFISVSQTYGWKFYGAMPSPSQRDLKVSKSKPTKWYDMEGLGDPTSRYPVALVLGNEADGLRPSIQKLMNSFVTIRRADEVDVVVDSLNVGVAASILTHAFLYPAVKGAISEPAKDRRTERRQLAAGAAAENMLFQVDDGKYTAPRYEGANKLAATTMEAAGGGFGERPSLLTALEDREVEVEDPLKGWNPDDGLDESWEETGDNDIVDEKEERGSTEKRSRGEEELKGLKESEEEWEDETEELSDDEASFEIDQPILKEAQEELISEKENSEGLEDPEGLEKKMASEVASEFTLDKFNIDRSDDEFDDEFVNSTEETSEEVTGPSTAGETKTNTDTTVGASDDDLDWEDIHEMAEEGIRGQEDLEAKRAQRKEGRAKSYEWDAIKPAEVDFTAGLVGPPPVTKETPEPKKGDKAPPPEKNDKIPPPLPKRLLEIADAKGIKINGTPTKKQKKLLKKEGKKLQQKLRKKVREDASKVREALNDKRDPKVLKDIKGQSQKRNEDLNREKNEEKRKEREKAKEEKKLRRNENAKGKARRIKKKDKDRTDPVKQGTWNISEVMQ